MSAGKSGISRRAFVRTSAAAGGMLAAPMLNRGRFRAFARTAATYSARAISLIEENLVIDMLSIMAPLDDLFISNKPDYSFDLADAQVAKLQSMGINVFHPAVGIGGPEAREKALRFVAAHNARIANRPDLYSRVDSAADLDAVRTSGKLGVIIGIQNSDHFVTADDVGRFHALGQRVSQLTYNTQNRIGSGSTEREDGGISDFGVSVIGQMNKFGMAVDVSHSGDRTTLDACELSKKPVLFTHSNSRLLSGGHPRTKTDEAIRKMAASGGVMGITGVRSFVKKDEPTTIENMIDHYDHVIKLVGIEHVGIGSDIDPDGYDDMTVANRKRLKANYKASYGFRDKLDTDGFDHPKRTYDLVEGLIRRGYTDSHIAAILGANFRRALGRIWTPEGAAE